MAAKLRYRAHDGLEYFFHLTDLADVTWEEIDVGMDVEFLPVKTPSSDRAGKASSIQITDYDGGWEDDYEDDESGVSADDPANDDSGQPEE